MKSKKLLLLISLLFAGTTIKPAIVSFNDISTENKAYFCGGFVTCIATQYVYNKSSSAIHKAIKKVISCIGDSVPYVLFGCGIAACTWLILQKK